jgi:hypothetical protein
VSIFKNVVIIEACHFINYMQSFIQHPFVNSNSINRILRNISVDFDVAGRLNIIYFAFFKYLEKIE